MSDALTRPLGGCANLAAEVQTILVRALSLGDAQFGNIQLMDWRSGYLHIAAHHGLSADFLAFFARVKANDGSACAKALGSKKAIIVRNVETDAVFSPVCRNAVLATGARSVSSFPLLSTSGAFVGVLSTHFSCAHEPSDRELDVMRALAQEGANAIILHRGRAKEPISSSRELIANSRELLLRLDRQFGLQDGTATCGVLPRSEQNAGH